MGKFDYGKYFGEIQPLADALREGEARCWEDTVPRNPGAAEYVLYLGCNVLRTVNLAEAAVEILKSLGLDFTALGGPANCCGIIHDNNGDEPTALKLAESTFSNFVALRPKQVLVFCPSCHFRMDEVIPGRWTFDIPYLHLTEFLAARLDRPRLTHPVRRRVALHAHTATPQQERDSAATEKILRAIPDLEVVRLEAPGDWGRHCTAPQAAKVGLAKHRAMVDGLFDEAARQGADAVVTVYHSCYRELCGRETRPGLEVLNYLQLACEGLGIRVYEERYKQLKLAGDPEQAFRSLQPTAEARGVNLKRLRAATRTQFTGGGD